MTYLPGSVPLSLVMSGATYLPGNERPLLGKWPGNRASSVCPTLLSLFRRSAGVAAERGNKLIHLEKLELSAKKWNKSSFNYNINNLKKYNN